MFPVLSANSASGYFLTKSLRFRSSASAYLNRTPASAGNRTTWTWSAWVKRCDFNTNRPLISAYSDASNRDILQFDSTVLQYVNISGGSANTNLATTQVFRDIAGWYHIVFVADTTQSTASNRFKLYVNGSQVTSFGTATYPSQNTNTMINNNVANYIGREVNGSQYAEQYMAEINFVDGQALTPTSFGSTNALTGVWQPAQYTGTYGTNGFYLKFTNTTSTSTLGNDFSGNGNNWTTNNFSLTAGSTYDSMTDVPTLTDATTANYETFNPIGNGGGSISNGNLTSSTSSSTPDVGTLAMQSGKWYWEITLTTSSNPRVGMYDVGSAAPSNLGANAYGWAIINSPSRLYYNGTTPSYGSFVGNSGSIVMVAYDATAGNLWFGENGSWFASGNPATGANPSISSVTGKAIVPAVASGTGANVFNGNFGQQPFSYTPPTGFNALNTYNLSTSTIVKGNTVMDATLYTGTGASQSVANASGFQPDFVWIKSRSAVSNHGEFDSVRPSGYALYPNLTDAEADNSSLFTGITSTGFGVAGTNVTYNQNAATYVGWQWQAGKGTTSSNTSGSITSTVSVNATAGFSIVTYTGTGASNATVGHGLGVAPKMVILKARTINATSNNWWVNHSSLTSGNNLYLNTTSAQFAVSGTTSGGLGTMNSTIFTLANGVATNNNTNQTSCTYVAYCWSEIAGFSSFGSYTGNGSTDGPFVYLGFRPRWIMFKRTDATQNWQIFDTARDTYNPEVNSLWANLANAEGNGYAIDYLSNGFKPRLADSGYNASGGTYIYAAFAENPFKNALAR